MAGGSLVGDPQDLVTWWDLVDAAAGQPVLGWGPFGNHGSLVGGLTPGGAARLAFDGHSGYVSVPHPSSLERSNSITSSSDQWSVWCRIKRGPTGAVR